MKYYTTMPCLLQMFAFVGTAVSMLAGSTKAQNTIHVQAQGSQHPDGSLENPYQSLQAAVVRARQSQLNPTGRCEGGGQPGNACISEKDCEGQAGWCHHTLLCEGSGLACELVQAQFGSLRMCRGAICSSEDEVLVCTLKDERNSDPVVVDCDVLPCSTDDGCAIADGACIYEEFDTILLGPGRYMERFTPGDVFTLSDEVTLTASSGTAIIGGLADRPNTTLKVLTYNIHLFGNEVQLLEDIPFFCDLFSCPETFMEKCRLRLIADELVTLVDDEGEELVIDVVAIQEAWDDEFIRSDFLPRVVGKFPYHYLNEDNDGGSVLDSGLLLISRYKLEDPQLEFYDDERGADGYASKGFEWATIHKDGFEIGLFTTHLQAGGRKKTRERTGQLQQLGEGIAAYRAGHPSAEVVLMGDFNVDGSCCVPRSDFQYYCSMLSNLGLKDAFPNTPGFACLRAPPGPDDDGDLDTTCRDWCSEAPSTCPKSQFFSQSTDIDVFKKPKKNKLIDHVLYSYGNAYAIHPVQATIIKPKAEPPMSLGLCADFSACGTIPSACGSLKDCDSCPALLYQSTSRDLSDHYALLVEFSLSR